MLKPPIRSQLGLCAWSVVVLAAVSLAISVVVVTSRSWIGISSAPALHAPPAAPPVPPAPLRAAPLGSYMQCARAPTNPAPESWPYAVDPWRPADLPAGLELFSTSRNGTVDPPLRAPSHCDCADKWVEGSPWWCDIGAFLRSADGPMNGTELRRVGAALAERALSVAQARSCDGVACSGHGWCNVADDPPRCMCSHAWDAAENCSQPRRSICNFAAHGWILSGCFAHCGPLARCLCGPNSTYPDRAVGAGVGEFVPGAPGAPPASGDGSWPVLLPPGWLYTPTTGAVAAHAAAVDKRCRNATAPPKGLCEWAAAPRPPVPYCEASPADAFRMRRELFWGRMPKLVLASHEAETPSTSAPCLSQCSGHGRCVSINVCACAAGYIGADCSQRVQMGPSPKLTLDRPFARRPLIYVYELSAGNAHGVAEWSPSIGYGELRTYAARMHNDTAPVLIRGQERMYHLEMALHEFLLRSPHRTLDPEQADLFYIPIWPSTLVARGGGNAECRSPRPQCAAERIAAALAEVQSRWPFWRRRGGRDHMWASMWDEGSCFIPRAGRAAMVLTHWGNAALHARGTTAYAGDVWDQPAYLDRFGHPGQCFDPRKDIVLPPFKPRPLPTLPPLRERPQTLFFYFAGNLGRSAHKTLGVDGGRGDPIYSLGIRQRLAHVLLNASSRGVVIEVHTQKYITNLASSVFCGVFPGDGWSARLEDAIHYGCIPVIIQDNVWLAWENVLDFDLFAVRIAQADIDRTEEILRAIPVQRVRAMQRALYAVRSRFSWDALRLVQDIPFDRAGLTGDAELRAVEEAQRAAGDDALATLMRVLAWRAAQVLQPRP